jgi:hypothetical protein
MIHSAQPLEQAREVLTRFDLHGQVAPLSRCLVCNGEIARVDKAGVADRLPPRTRVYAEEIFTCQVCGRLYWRGAHYRLLAEKIRRISKDTE